MSYGVVMCATCKREVHQDGPNRTWLHCVDKTPICDAAVYRDVYGEGVGPFCGKDGFGEKEI